MQSLQATWLAGTKSAIEREYDKSYNGKARNTDWVRPLRSGGVTAGKYSVVGHDS